MADITKEPRPGENVIVQIRSIGNANHAQVPQQRISGSKRVQMRYEVKAKGTLNMKTENSLTNGIF